MLLLTTTVTTEKKGTETLFALRSHELGENFSLQHYAAGARCKGENTSPQLYWENRPSGTKAFALILFDIDAPGGGFWHWLVGNIPPEISELQTGAGHASGSRLPKGAVQTKTDAGTTGYYGPCPPAGPKHRYVFTVHALDSLLILDPAAEPETIAGLIKKHSLASASMTVFGQKQ